LKLNRDFKSKADRQYTKLRKAGFTLAGMAAILATTNANFASSDQIIEHALTANAPGAATYQMQSTP